MAEAQNPFADPLRFERRVPECAIVIFGASGDLTKRKLMPALYQLAQDRKLPASFAVIGNSRTPLTDEAFREKMAGEVEHFLESGGFDPELWARFAANLHYVAGDMNDPALYKAIGEKLAAVGQRNVLYYLSTQPSYYATVAAGLGAAGLGGLAAGAATPDSGWRRIVVEKPFGHDLLSARELNAKLHAVFPEPEIYRIDHYLGKETVQNILAFRFGNGIFEPLWNRRYVNHVQITASEAIGVEGRGAYYQEAGALRDMVQNHLLQVLATVAMEPAAVFEPNAVRDERAKLLRSIKIMQPQEVPQYAVAGQYDGFRQEPGVDPSSPTDTFAAITFYVDNWRWAGVPFFVRTGKKLAKRSTDIAIQFNSAPLTLFASDGDLSKRPNLLILRIQPEEGISLRFFSKQPGSGMHLRPVSMDFKYGTSFGGRSPSAYETLLVDAMVGDATLYTRQDMVEASWKVVEPIMQEWKTHKSKFPNYESGSWGPAEADAMLARTGHVWRDG